MVVFDTTDYRAHAGITHLCDLTGEHDDWRAWLDGDLYGVIVEQHTATGCCTSHDSLFGLYGSAYAEEQAAAMLAAATAVLTPAGLTGPPATGRRCPAAPPVPPVPADARPSTTQLRAGPMRRARSLPRGAQRMAETFAEYVAKYGRPDGDYPVIDLDTADLQRQTVIVTFAGGRKKAIVQVFGLAAGQDNEHLCLDVHAFVDDQVARSSVHHRLQQRRLTVSARTHRERQYLLEHRADHRHPEQPLHIQGQITVIAEGVREETIEGRRPPCEVGRRRRRPGMQMSRGRAP